jgi:hypothetical protein
VVKNDYPGAGSVRYVQQNGNDCERNEPITSGRINSNSLFKKKIHEDADNVEGNVNQGIPTARNAVNDVVKFLIDKGSRDIGKNTMF